MTLIAALQLQEIVVFSPVLIGNQPGHRLR